MAFLTFITHVTVTRYLLDTPSTCSASDSATKNAKIAGVERETSLNTSEEVRGLVLLTAMLKLIICYKVSNLLSLKEKKNQTIVPSLG